MTWHCGIAFLLGHVSMLLLLSLFVSLVLGGAKQLERWER